MATPSAAAISWTRRLRALYGEEPKLAPRVVHVAATSELPDGGRPVLRISAATPTSATDAFALEAARARVDAILTTGENLRREPSLRHRLGPEASAWRREVLGLDTPPRSIIWTRHPSEFLMHRLFTRETGAILLTPESTRGDQALETRCLVFRATSLVHAIDCIEAALGVRSTLIEAGPSTARDLYRTPERVDELLLSIYRGPALPAALLLPEFASAPEIESRLGAPVYTRTVEQDGIPWRFERYLRSSPR